MKHKNKLDSVKAAQQFIGKHFPDCNGAVLAGSVVRGEATKTSDLDIVVFDKKLMLHTGSHLLTMAGRLKYLYIT